MKKAMLIIAPLAATLFFASCSKCKVCTKQDSPEIRLCEGDYNSTTEYGFAVDATEANGYDCSESL